jgi:hypothetical protein
MIFSIFIHRLFCAKTTLTKLFLHFNKIVSTKLARIILHLREWSYDTPKDAAVK